MNIHRSPTLYLSRNLSDLKKKNTRLPAPERLSAPVQAINARNCLLKTLPVDIELYPHITHLNLSRNRLEKLLAKLTALQALTHLDLSFNHFETFPQVLINMPSLQWIDMRHARQPDYHTGYDTRSYRPIDIPEAFRKANPDCQILTDENTPVIDE